jgi:hypothetical protein
VQGRAVGARVTGAQAEALAHVLVSYLVAPPVRDVAPAPLSDPGLIDAA